jgi:LysM repeat protein
MSKKDAKNIISSYRKKQKIGPYIIGGLAILLAVAGIILLVIYLLGGSNGMQISFFSTSTPTPTETPTPTLVPPTATFTMTPTATNTPTVTPTNTPSAPFEYEVQEGDNCTDIAEEFEVEVEVLLVLNNLTSSCFITPGQIILIPIPGQQLPTATPVPEDLPAGTLIEHRIRPGDSLYALAEKFNSDIDRIFDETNRYRRDNDLREMEDRTDLFVGDILIIPYNVGPNPIVPGGTSTPTPEP